MPYERLPARLRQLIPDEKGQEIFRRTFNSQMESGRSESVSFATAWGKLKDAGYKRDPKSGVWSKVEKSRKDTLKDKVDEWNEKYSDKHGRVTVSMLEDVYDRGIGAYRTNPGSVRPNVKSKEQWAFARVNSFLDAARGSKKITHDQDIHDKISKSQPSVSAVHVPSTGKKEIDKEESFKPPAGARSAARKALKWRDKYGDKVKGGTRVGWERANQLANGENLSRDTIGRMASFFARHKGNEKINEEYKGEPWRDAGYVSFLLWGGATGRSWANSKMDSFEKRQVEDDQFTEQSEAVVRSMDLGLEGEIHVHERNGQAIYMPGKDHEEYLGRIRQMANIESDDDDDYEPVKEGLLERTISAIIGAVMPQVDVNKSHGDAKILKMDDEQRIVYGWASVVTEDGNPVVDTQGDVISPSEMEKMANNFMLDVRKAKAMHEGGQIGEVIHSMPLTEELMKAFDIYSDREGWLIAMKVHDDETWSEMKKGKFTGFSVGGKAGSREMIE